MATGKKALVLSGGSIKGAFQAGALQAVFNAGFEPDFVYGISVGSLNGSFITGEAGKQPANTDWKQIGINLIDFWKTNIKKPSDVAEKRSFLSIAWKILWGKFDGITDTKPIHNLVRKTIKIENLRSSPVKIKVGAVNLISSDIVYADPTYPDFIDYVLASTAIPVAMPGVKIGGKPFFDGGLKDVAPLEKAIDEGATEIVCIACQAEHLGVTEANFNYQNLISLSERFTDIMVNELVNNDLKKANYANEFLPDDGSPKTDTPFKDYRKLKIITIRPPETITLDIDKFNQDDIAKLISSGFEVGKEAMKNYHP